jgi:transcriptional antiterminator RfaH
MEKIWRAIYVNSRSEKKVAASLVATEVETYVPLIKTMRQWSDRKKMVELPLLGGYVFVRIAESEKETVLQTKGVVGFVRSEGKIAVVRNEEVGRLRQLVELGYQLEVLKLDRELRKGEKVKIGSGVLRGLEGIVLEHKDQQDLLVLLESIGQCIKVRVPKEILLTT